MLDHPTSPRFPLAPTTGPGRWAIRLFVLSIAALAVFFLMAATGQTGGDRFSDNWLLSGPMFLAAGSAVAGLIAAAVAAVGGRDRGLLLLAPVLWGLLVLVFAIGEFANPH
jgi:hypothetical protein